MTNYPGVASPTDRTPTQSQSTKFVQLKTNPLVFTCDEKENTNGAGSALIMKQKQRSVFKKKGEVPAFKQSAQKHLENYKNYKSGHEFGQQYQTMDAFLGDKCYNRPVKINNLVTAEE